MTAEPREPVGDERPPDAVAVSDGVDADALEEALAVGATGDRVTEELVADLDDPKSTGRRGVECLDEPGPVESPKGTERALVHREDDPMLSDARATRRMPGCRDVDEVVLEQVEAFVHGETGIDEREHIDRTECVGHHGQISPAPEQADAAMHDLGRGRLAGADREVRDVFSSPPGSESSPSAGPAQGVLRHRPSSVRARLLVLW